MLAIEIDGDTHIDKIKYDEIREFKLKKLGIHFLRFDGHTVLKNTYGVIQSILDWIEEYEETHPQPLSRGE